MAGISEADDDDEVLDDFDITQIGGEAEADGEQNMRDAQIVAAGIEE